mmetsp:Transcript_17792/g.2469  ORF Transcript_17792/g.2469 Transcript_17792/m.2469 type:complete len:99 (+) Transcript_17792:181-477(+)
MFVLSLVATFLMAIAVATIDTGYMNNKLHGGSAVGGFLFMYFCIIIITYLYIKIKPTHPHLVSEKSLNVKKTLCVTLAAIIVYVLTNITFLSGHNSIK